MQLQTTIFCELIKNIIHPCGESSLQGEVDWSYLVQLAKDHNMLPLFVEEGNKHSSYICRSEYVIEMEEAMLGVAAQVRRTSAFLRLYRAFVEADLHPMVMKGLICRKLYGDLCDHRPSADEDILIRPSDYEKAKSVLLQNGYIAELEVQNESQLRQLQEVSFIHPEERLHIELHLNPMGRQNELRSRMSDCFLNVFEDYREEEVDGVLMRTMNHQDHLLFLVLHAFKHLLSGGLGIRQMLDILLYQEKYGVDINLPQMFEKLQSFGAHAFWCDMVHIGNSYLGFQLSVLQEANCPEALLEDMILCGTFGNKTQAEATAGRATLFVSGNDHKSKSYNSLLMIWKLIFPNRVYLVDNAPYLQKYPWLLPVAWVGRWMRFVKKSKRSEGNLALESVKISQRRMKLLKKYGLV